MRVLLPLEVPVSLEVIDEVPVFVSVTLELSDAVPVELEF